MKRLALAIFIFQINETKIPKYMRRNKLSKHDLWTLPPNFGATSTTWRTEIRSYKSLSMRPFAVVGSPQNESFVVPRRALK
jgi:hypothetical protein